LVVALFVTPARYYLFEGLASLSENSGDARFRLEASNNYINVERIELDAIAYSPGILGGNESRPGGKKGIENNLAAVCQIDQCILQQCGRFHGRMILGWLALLEGERTFKEGQLISREGPPIGGCIQRRSIESGCHLPTERVRWLVVQTAACPPISRVSRLP
jgi:hypothetical protein